MKIAIVVNELNIRGGTHKQVLRLCQFLKRKNIDFVLATIIFESEKTYPEFSDFDVISLYHDEYSIPQRKHGGWIKSLFHDNKKLYQMLPSDVDIINIHDNGLHMIQYMAKHDRKKVVWQINDLPCEFRIGNSKELKKTVKSCVQKSIIKYLTKNADAITVNVSKNKERVEKELHENAKVFHCGVDINESLKVHQFEKKRDSFRLLTMGVFFEYRNYETLVLVIKEMVIRGKKIHLDIIGSTELCQPYAEKIFYLIKKNKLTQYIKIWGQVDERTYVDLFNLANAFAFINVDQSWGLAVFEAMSCGLPTIVSNSVGATELLHDEKDSIIVEPKNVSEICDKLERLMTNQEYYNFISENGATAVKSYSWDEMYSSKMLNLFKELEK